MRRRTHQKRALLFLAAVLLPSAVLVGTTLRLIRQQRELAARRTEEERALLALRVGQDLVEELRELGDRLGRSPLTPAGIQALIDSEPSVLTVAAVAGGRLVYPWEPRLDPPSALSSTTLRGYRNLLDRGEEAEYRVGNLVEAARLYGRAAAELESQSRAAGRDEANENDGSHAARQLLAEARVHQARALQRGGRTKEAQDVFRVLAESPPSSVDREGMPFSIYGLEGLFQSGADPGDLRRLLEATLEGTRCFSLPGLLAWRDVARAIESETGEGTAGGLGQAIEGAVAARMTTLETLERLQEEFSGLLAAAFGTSEVGGGSESPTWIPYGAEPWLVGVQTGIETTTTRVAVVRPALLLGRGEIEESPQADAGGMENRDWMIGAAGRGVRFLPAGDVGGQSLGPALNGLRASFPRGVPSPSDAGDVEGWFFRLLLPIILILTGFTAYLAWRDVKREAEAARLRSQFVSSVTHELKTPLTSIRMFAETLRMGRHAGPKAQQEYLDTVVHETERLSRLINNVLDLARIDRGEKTYRMAPADMGAAVGEAARAVAYPLAQGRHTLVTEISEDLPALEADSDALTQALLNLLSNAIKFSEEGTRIDLRAFLEGEDLLLQVEDRGRGISSRDQETIFEDFVRAADAEREGIPGTGLGLPLVAHVAEGHGGRVEVESEVGQGSTFTIRIPVERNARRGGEQDEGHVASATSTDGRSNQHSAAPDPGTRPGLQQEGTP